MICKQKEFKLLNTNSGRKELRPDLMKSVRSVGKAMNCLNVELKK